MFLGARRKVKSHDSGAHSRAQESRVLLRTELSFLEQEGKPSHKKTERIRERSKFLDSTGSEIMFLRARRKAKSHDLQRSAFESSRVFAEPCRRWEILLGCHPVAQVTGETRNAHQCGSSRV